MRHSLEKRRICTSRDPRSSPRVPIISAWQNHSQDHGRLLCTVHMSMRSLHCHFFFQPPIFLFSLFATCCLSLLSSSVTCCMRMFEICGFTHIFEIQGGILWFLVQVKMKNFNVFRMSIRSRYKYSRRSTSGTTVRFTTLSAHGML